MAKAAAVALHYEVHRTEHSIIYFSTDWKELEGSVDPPNKRGLLFDPLTFFREKRRAFGPGVPRRVPFRFAGPDISILLEPMLQNPTEALRALQAFGNTPDFETYSKFSGALNTAFGKTGAFLAEFALDTRMLCVRYYAPRKPTNRAIAGITPYTLAMVEGSKVGHLHFDLKNRNDLAKLAVNYIEDRQSLINLLNVGKLYYTDVKLVDHGNPLNYDDPAQRMDLVNFPFAPDKGYDGSTAHPTVVIDGTVYTEPEPTPDDPAPSPYPPCWVIGVRQDKDGNYCLGSCEIKAYTEPTPY